MYIIGITTVTRQRIYAVHCGRGIYLSVNLYLILELCLFVEKTGHVLEYQYQPTASIFLNQSLVSYFVLIRKLILQSKTIWQNMRKFTCTVWSMGTIPHINKEEKSFFLENSTLVWSEIFLDNYLSTRPGNLKASVKI